MKYTPLSQTTLRFTKNMLLPNDFFTNACGRSCIPSSAARSKNAFTLLEMTICLALMGIFMSALTMSIHQMTTFIGCTSETARHCREFRSFCEILTTDCEKLIFDRNRQVLEFQFPSQENKQFSLTFFTRLTKGPDHSLVSQGANSAILCAAQYQWHSRDHFVVRRLWSPKESLPSFTASSPRLEVLSQQTPILNRKLLSNISEFQLYPIDLSGRKQERYLSGNSIGLECLVTFRSRYRRQQPLTFHARIPLPRTGHKD